MNIKNNSKKYLKPDIKVYDIQPCAIMAGSLDGACIGFGGDDDYDETDTKSAAYRTNLWN